MKAALIPLASAVLAWPAVAGAAEGSPTALGYLPKVAMVWNIQQQVPDAAPATVKAGRAYARTRLIPPALYRLDAPAALPDGTHLLDANTELAALTGVARTACTMRVPPVAAAMKPASALWSHKNRFLCLQDADGDGRFERYVWLYSPMPMMLIGRWQWVPLEGQTAPAAYRQADPATTQDAPWLHLVLINDGSWVRKLRFGGVLAARDYGAQVVPYTSYIIQPEKDVSIKAMPAPFEAFGGAFEVTGRTADGLTIRTIKPIPPGPLSAGW